MPPYPVDNGSRQVRFSSDDRHVVIYGCMQSISVLKLDLLDRPPTKAAELMTIGELSASRQLEVGDEVKLSTNQWMKKWNDYRRNTKSDKPKEHSN